MYRPISTSLNQWQKSKDGDAIFQFEKSQIEIVMKQYNVESALQLCGLPYIHLMQSDLSHYLLMVEPKEPLPIDCSSIRADIDNLWPIKDSSFSSIIFSHTTERTQKGLDQLINEAHRVLEDNGLLIILSISLTSLIGVQRLLQIDGNHWCHSLYSDFYLHARLIEAGFEIQPSIDFPQKHKWLPYSLPKAAMLGYKMTIAQKKEMGALLNTSMN